MSSKKKKKTNKRKINKKRVAIFLIVLSLFIFFLYKLFTTNISNIYISGNVYLTDQEIIDMSGLKDYPRIIKNLPITIKKRLKKSESIISVKVKYKGFFNRIYIEVKENYPLFYYQVEEKLVLFDGTKVEKIETSTVVVNQIPNTVYDKFVEKMRLVDTDVLNRMSEIAYKPNDVDASRFLVLMNDGNYVYLTINKFLTINKYINILKSFDNKHGVLYLDSGEYFDIFDE